jgi:hypothetical protein
MARKHEREAERRMAMGASRYARDVQERMTGLGGQSTSKLEPDAQRGASSPLGHGTHSWKEK